MKEYKHNLVNFSLEERGIHSIILGLGKLSDIGLLNGKMGISIFLFIYSKYRSNELLRNLAEELLDEIWREASRENAIIFGSGLLGIGWGIEYLIQNKFVEGKSNEICEDIDSKIMEIDPRRIINYSLESGLLGLLHYVLYHLKSCINQNSKLPFDSMYLKDLYLSVQSISSTINEYEIQYLKDQYINFYQKGDFLYQFNIQHFIRKVNFLNLKDSHILSKLPLGLDGVSGALTLKYSD